MKWKTCGDWRGPKLGFTVIVFDGNSKALLNSYEAK